MSTKQIYYFPTKEGIEDVFERLIQAKLKEFPDMTYAVAFREVQKETPKLTQEYIQAEFGSNPGKVAGDELDKLTQAKLKQFSDMPYVVAFKEVLKENPKLTQEYIQEIY